MNISFRLMTRADFPLLSKWLSKPHIKERWKEDSSLAAVTRKYGPEMEIGSPTTLFVVESDAAPIGMMQSYIVDDYPEHAESVNLPGAIGVDLFIGEEEYLGKGYGPAILKAFMTTVIPARYPHATQVVADPSVDNPASIRAFEKAGFYKGSVVDDKDGLEQLMIAKIERGPISS